jgi:hypothetical protein
VGESLGVRRRMVDDPALGLPGRRADVREPVAAAGTRKPMEPRPERRPGVRLAGPVRGKVLSQLGDSDGCLGEVLAPQLLEELVDAAGQGPAPST